MLKRSVPKYDNLKNIHPGSQISNSIRQFLQVIRLVIPYCKYAFLFPAFCFSLEQPQVHIFFFYLLFGIRINIFKVKILEKWIYEKIPLISNLLNFMFQVYAVLVQQLVLCVVYAITQIQILVMRSAFFTNFCMKSYFGFFFVTLYFPMESVS